MGKIYQSQENESSRMSQGTIGAQPEINRQHACMQLYI